MMSESRARPSLFHDTTDTDLGRFAPKTGPAEPSPAADTIRRVSEEGGFPSRSPLSRKVPSPARQKAGRNTLLNARVTQRAHDRFHALVRAEQARFEAGEISHRVTLGEMVERALAALERERAGERAL